MGFFGIPILGIPGRDFLFWAKSRNLENPEILVIGIGILKPLRNPECKILKSRKNYIFYLREIWGDFLSPGSGFFSWDGISRQKAPSVYNKQTCVILNIRISYLQVWIKVFETTSFFTDFPR